MDNVVYIGPRPIARRLRSVATALQQAVSQLPRTAQQKFLRSKAIAWDDLATPRGLLSQLAEQNGIEIVGQDRVPHDLWAAAHLPPLSLIDRLTLIAGQFDLTFKIFPGGTRLELVPIPEHLPVVANGFQSPPPSPLTSTEQSTAAEGIRIDRLVIQNKPLGPVLRQLAARLGLEVRMDEKAIAAAGISLDRRVSVKVENVTVDGLLRQLLTPAGLTFHRRQKVVDIRPAKSP